MTCLLVLADLPCKHFLSKKESEFFLGRLTLKGKTIQSVSRRQPFSDLHKGTPSLSDWFSNL